MFHKILTEPLQLRGIYTHRSTISTFTCSLNICYFFGYAAPNDFENLLSIFKFSDVYIANR